MPSNKDGDFLGKIFIGPVEIAGIAEGLSNGLCKLGVDAEVVTSGLHHFRYGSASDSRFVYLWQRLGKARNSIPRRKLLLKFLMVCAHGFWGWLVLLRSLVKYDVFIFLYGQTITNSAFELWLLRRAGRKIIFAGVGSDTRPPYIDGGLFPGEADGELPDPAFLVEKTRRCKERLRLQERYASYWINSPAAAHFHERPFIAWPAMGIPRNIFVSKLGSRREGGPVRILHCPSSPLAKGTPIILEAIGRLRKKGYEIDFVLIQNMPNDRVLQELERCDFVVDQLYSDAPMAGFATEAAYFGRPAVVAGYFAPWVDHCLEVGNTPPSLFVLPDNIESAIERLIVDVRFRRELGEKAQFFVKSHWDVCEVAKRFLRLIRDDIPEQWWFDPKKICYLEGSGLPRERVRRLVTSVIEYGGVLALQLHDKPIFERAFCEFSGCLPSMESHINNNQGRMKESV